MATRLSPYTVTDDKGEYTVFPGKHCTFPGCGVALTSRNRPEPKLICIDHLREKNRLRKRPPRVRKAKAAYTSVDPRKAKVHLALATWLCFPTDAYAVERLQGSLRDYELFYRFRPIPESSETTPIPVEECESPNLLHRTTRLEFLADCKELGA